MSGDDERHDGDHRGSVAPELRARIAELETALMPFARFWEAQRRLGKPSPQTGELFVVRSGDEPVAITIEDLKNAHRVSMKP